MEGKDLFNLDDLTEGMSIEEMQDFLDCWHGNELPVENTMLQDDPSIEYRKEYLI